MNVPIGGKVVFHRGPDFYMHELKIGGDPNFALIYEGSHPQSLQKIDSEFRQQYIFGEKLLVAHKKIDNLEIFLIKSDIFQDGEKIPNYIEINVNNNSKDQFSFLDDFTFIK